MCSLYVLYINKVRLLTFIIISIVDDPNNWYRHKILSQMGSGMTFFSTLSCLTWMISIGCAEQLKTIMMKFKKHHKEIIGEFREELQLSLAYKTS